MTADTVTLIEVGPRDGLQSERAFLDTEQKVAFITRSIAAGLRRIEAVSFARPDRVPQMADAEAVMAALPRPEGVSYIGLVMNRRGFERACATGLHEIGYVVPASDTFCRRNQGTDTARALDIWREIAEPAREAGLLRSVLIATAFGCPYEGEVAATRVAEIAEAIVAIGVDELALADSIGAAVPSEVTQRFQALARRWPDLPLRGHFHNTRNTGIANVYAAHLAGVRAFDASTGGIGGCPFAPGATGNVATEDLAYLFARMGVQTGIDLEAVIANAHWLGALLERPMPSMLSRSGPFPRPPAAHSEAAPAA